MAGIGNRRGIANEVGSAAFITAIHFIELSNSIQYSMSVVRVVIIDRYKGKNKVRSKKRLREKKKKGGEGVIDRVGHDSRPYFALLENTYCTRRTSYRGKLRPSRASKKKVTETKKRGCS